MTPRQELDSGSLKIRTHEKNRYILYAFPAFGCMGAKAVLPADSMERPDFLCTNFGPSLMPVTVQQDAPPLLIMTRADGKPHGNIDIAIAVEHLCLAATEQGLATCWVCNFDANLCKEQFGLPENEEPAVIIPLGYAADEMKPKSRKAIDEIMEQREQSDARINYAES